MNKSILTIISTVVFSLGLIPSFAHAQSGCSAGYDCSERGVGVPGANECGNGEWESLLVTQESGGSYTIGAGNSSALGRYQFIDDTRQSIGDKYGLPCSSGAGSRDGFANCPGLQDDYGRALWKNDLEFLMSNSQVAANVNSGASFECPVTASGITALAHNVGPECARLWAIGGESHMKANGPVFNGVPSGTPACTDANGTNAVEKYACAMGGYDMSAYGVGAGAGGAVASGCGFGFDPASPASANFRNTMLGCDPQIKEGNKVIEDALNQSNAEIIKASIQQPTPIEVMACTDQQVEMMNASGQLHANPGGDISNALGPLAQNPLMNSINSFSNNVVETTDGFLNPVMGAINNVTASLAGDFASMIPSLAATIPSMSIGEVPSLFQGVNAPTPDCEMREQVWLLNECVEMPEIPSLSEIIGGKVGELAGAFTSPDRMIEQVCSAADSSLQGFFGDLNGTFEKAAEDSLSPISDVLD